LCNQLCNQPRNRLPTRWGKAPRATRKTRGPQTRRFAITFPQRRERAENPDSAATTRTFLQRIPQIEETKTPAVQGFCLVLAVFPAAYGYGLGFGFKSL
jgi:hypothetical protein